MKWSCFLLILLSNNFIELYLFANSPVHCIHTLDYIYFAVSKPSVRAVFQLFPKSSSSNVAALLLSGWPSSPALSLYTDCRQGQAGTRDWLLRYAQHSSSYPCLAPPVLSCHIQSLIFVLNLQLFHCSSLPDLWRESYPRSCDYFSWVSVLYECRMYDWVIWLIKNSFIVILNI